MKRYRFMLPLLGLVVLAVVLAVGIVHSPDKDVIPSPLIGKAAPDFSVPNLMDGAPPVSTSLLQGHWSLVNVWGSWCDSCRAEHATLLMIRKQGAVPIIGIDWNDTNADARNWLRALGDPYSTVGQDPTGHVAIAWGVYGAPESFLVNPQGVIVAKQIGAMTPEIWQRDFLARIPPSERSAALPGAAGSGAAADPVIGGALSSGASPGGAHE